MTNGLEKAKKLTEIEIKSLRLIANRNSEGMGARMPYAEMIEAADDLVSMGLAEWRNQPPGAAGRWITPLGLTALQSLDTGGGEV
jgi:hypothetical protein